MHSFIKLTKVVLDQPEDTPKEYIYFNIDNIVYFLRSMENEHHRTRVFTVEENSWFEVEETLDEIMTILEDKWS